MYITLITSTIIAQIPKLLKNCLNDEFVFKNLGPTKTSKQIRYIIGKITSDRINYKSVNPSITDITAKPSIYFFL